MVNRLRGKIIYKDSENILDWQKLGKSFLVLGEIKESN